MSLFVAPRWDEDSDKTLESLGSNAMEASVSPKKRRRKRGKKHPSTDSGLSVSGGHHDRGSQPLEGEQSRFQVKGILKTIKDTVNGLVGKKQENAVLSNDGSPQGKGEGAPSRRVKRRLAKKRKKLNSVSETEAGKPSPPVATDNISTTNEKNKTEEPIRLSTPENGTSKSKRKRAKKKKKGAAGAQNPQEIELTPKTPEGDTSLSKNSDTKREKDKIKRKLRRQMKALEKLEDSLYQDKTEKHLKVLDKKEKAEKAKVNLVSESNEVELKSKNEADEKRKLKMKLRKIAKRNKRKSNAQERKLTNNAPSSNEVVLSDSQKRKMLEIARKETEGKGELGENNMCVDHGTVNSTFDVSLSELPLDSSINGNQLAHQKKKRRRQKKKNNKVSDVVDGNSLSSQVSTELKNSFKEADLPDISESGDNPEKVQRKKMIIAKLLKQADIVEKTTLQSLKQKRRLEREENDEGTESAKKSKHIQGTLRERMSEQLKSARFRWLNEHLYTSNSWDALKFFKEDPEAFEAYHSGYRNQVAVWPVNPLDVIIKSLSSLSAGAVVADFGCGEARLAESLPNLKVHSLDLIASKPGVVACDMAHTPLLMESVDVAVFCLSLMGKNLNDFVLEANRVLKNGGLLMIAEVESRFEDVDNFTSAMVHFGFTLKNKDLSHQMFIFLDFKKSKKVSKTGKLPSLSLDPCTYKKR